MRFSLLPTKGEKHVPGAVSWGSHSHSILQYFLQAYFLSSTQNTASESSYCGIACVSNLWGIASEFRKNEKQNFKQSTREEASLGVKGKVAGEVASRLTVICLNHLQLFNTNFRYYQAWELQLCSFFAPPPSRWWYIHMSTSSLNHQPPSTWLKSLEKVPLWCWSRQWPWKFPGRDRVLFAISQVEPARGGNVTPGPWRSNLPQLEAAYPPTDCKHCGSLWYWADCCFIRARTRVSGEELCLSLLDELVYFPGTWEAQNKLIGKQRVYQTHRKHSRWYRTAGATPKPQQKA